MAIVVGTSSWSNPGFVEHWYPQRMAAKDRLDFYGRGALRRTLFTRRRQVPNNADKKESGEATPGG